MSFDALIVRVTAAFFVLYGLAFIFFPEPLSQFVTDTVPDSASGLIDMRATYGGMSLAVGALLFLLAARQDSLRQGLLGVILIMLGMASGRIYGMVVDGSANQIMYVYLGLELAVAAVAGWTLARATPAR